MTAIQPVQTSHAPAAMGPYSQAVKVGGFLFCSGQLGIVPATGQLAEGVEAQTRQALENLSRVLKAAGTDMSRVVKTTIFLLNLADFQLVNQIYGAFFVQPFPARSTVQVSALPKNALVEIEAIAIP